MLYLHVGLHKTGTTSIQNGCHYNRRLLKRFSIWYPDDVRLTYNTEMHLGLSEQFANLKELIDPDWFKQYQHVFLSNEELGPCISRSDKSYIDDVFSWLNDNVSPVSFVITIREDVRLLSSAVREHIQGTTFPRTGINSLLRDYYLATVKLAESISEFPVIVVNIDDAKGANWNSFFFMSLFQKEIRMPDFTLNSSREKSASDYLGGFFRSFFSVESGEPLYSASVNKEVSRATASIRVTPEFWADFEPRLESYIENAVRQLVNRDDYVPFDKLFKRTHYPSKDGHRVRV